jgi:hypothetical protein
MRRVFPLLALIGCLSGPWGGVAAAELPALVQQQAYALRPVGSGELRWLGFPIYDAGLWTTSGTYAGFGPVETVALSLDYQRAFSREELLEITETAWRKLGRPDDARREAWLADLERIWSDVAPGDNVTTVVVPGGPTRFYDRHRRFGEVGDPAFGPAFLAIWLDPRSVVRDLRVQLLGSGKAAQSAAN